MTVREFWEIVDAIDVDSRENGRYTNDEIYRIGCAFIEMNNAEKREIGGWDRLVEILQPLDKNGEVMKKGDTFRQWIKGHRYAKGEMVHNEHMLSGKTIDGLTFKEFKDKTETIKQDLYKQQVKTRDTLNAYRRIMRSEARLEDFKDFMKDVAGEIGDLPEVVYDGPRAAGEGGEEKEAVLMLSDLHIGVQINNFYNKYNVEIARKRVRKLVNDTVRYCRGNDVTRLYVLGLGDAVHGLIHTSARLEQQMDVAKQIMVACEVLADALNRLQEAAPEVVFCSCTDNHSRMVADLSESIESENFGKLIVFYLKARLAGSKVEFKEDNLDDEIGMIEFANGKVGVFVHGHHDNICTIFQNMTAYTGRVVDYAFVGHYHSEKTKTFNGFRVFVNGSIVGMDQYAFSKRLFGKPSQTLLIFDGDNIINHSIGLDIV